ncbi:MAG: BON domain-containing protein [Caldimonas sp.]
MKRNFARTLRATTLALAGTIAVTGCAPLLVGGAIVGGSLVATDRRTSGAQIDDEVIELKAKRRIDEALGERGQISVTSYNRIVLMTGIVTEAADKATAEQAVGRIDNVQSVVNELAVGIPRSFVNRSNDTLITAKVKASIVDAKDLFANSVKVVTSQAVVYLMGRVTEREATRSAEVARGVSGVRKVVRVFEIITEAELANTAAKAPAKP